jgi:signal transduction histidine kinase
MAERRSGLSTPRLCLRGMSIVFKVAGDPKDVHPIVAEEIAFIGREAMRNAYKHSQATRLETELCYGADLTLRVRDNGKGLPADVVRLAKPGHFGMQGMQERAAIIAGTLRFVSSDAGTEMILVVPGNVVFARQGRRPFRPREL